MKFKISLSKFEPRILTVITADSIEQIVGDFLTYYFNFRPMGNVKELYRYIEQLEQCLSRTDFEAFMNKPGIGGVGLGTYNDLFISLKRLKDRVYVYFYNGLSNDQYSHPDKGYVLELDMFNKIVRAVTSEYKNCSQDSSSYLAELKNLGGEKIINSI